MRRLVAVLAALSLLSGCAQLPELNRLRKENKDWQRRIELMKKRIAELPQTTVRVAELDARFKEMLEEQGLAATFEEPELMRANLVAEVAGLAEPLGVRVRWAQVSELETDSEGYFKRGAQLVLDGSPESVKSFLVALANSGLEDGRPVRLRQVSLKGQSDSLQATVQVDFYIRGFTCERKY